MSFLSPAKHASDQAGGWEPEGIKKLPNVHELPECWGGPPQHSGSSNGCLSTKSVNDRVVFLGVAHDAYVFDQRFRVLCCLTSLKHIIFKQLFLQAFVCQAPQLKLILASANFVLRR